MFQSEWIKSEFAAPVLKFGVQLLRHGVGPTVGRTVERAEEKPKSEAVGRILVRGFARNERLEIGLSATRK